jgi:hypothetical protein
MLLSSPALIIKNQVTLHIGNAHLIAKISAGALGQLVYGNYPACMTSLYYLFAQHYRLMYATRHAMCETHTHTYIYIFIYVCVCVFIHTYTVN